MTATLRRGAVVVVLVVLAACGQPGPTAPTGISPPPTTSAPSPPPPQPRSFPPLAGPARTFTFDRELSYGVRSYTRESRFVLFDNGAFVLQYPTISEGGYRGEYKERDGVILFEWEGWSGGGPWGATGTLEGELLTVRYNEIMQHSDFEDAVYLMTSQATIASLSTRLQPGIGR